MSYYDYELPVDSDDDMSLMSNRQKVNNLLAESEGDGLFYKTKRFDNEKNCWRQVNIFSSGSTGSTIRHAITGESYPGHKVGSANEDFYFKVRISTGEFGQLHAPTLFYETAEQYERHMFCEVDQAIKNKFLAKQQEAERIRALGQ